MGSNNVVKFKFWQMWDKVAHPSKRTPDMEAGVKLKHDCEALLGSALAPLAETNPKTGKPVTIFCCGKTKSYFRFGALEFLESHSAAGLDVHAIEMQRVARTFLVRKKLLGSAKARKDAVFIIQRFARRMTAKNEANELRDKLENEIKIAAQEPAKQAASQKIKLEESGKLIAFLQKETKKLKSANDKAKKEMKKVKETNERLVQTNESAGQSFELLNDQSKKMSNNTSG